MGTIGLGVDEVEVLDLSERIKFASATDLRKAEKKGTFSSLKWREH